MTIRIYRDANANAVFIEDNNGAQFLNNLHVVQHEPTDAVLTILDKSRNLALFSSIPHEQFVKEDDSSYGNTAQEVCDAINAVVSATGSGDGNIPEITSGIAINVTIGDSVNYELIATDGVAFEWNNLPAGVLTVEGNIRQLIGVPSDGAGTYTPTMKAVNYFGVDEETLTITVANPPYANTKSVQFTNNDYCHVVPNNSNPFYRESNGAGVTDAWSVAAWFKGSNNNGDQTILGFGSDNSFEGSVNISWNGEFERVKLVYGSDSNNISIHTANSAVLKNTWTHIMIIYDGGTTGIDSGFINDYYSRFKIYINGVLEGSPVNSNSNYGFDGEVKAVLFKLGEQTSGGKHLKNYCKIDELSIWEGNESANITDIYNGGITHEMGNLASIPDHYYRMGDGDTFPILEDSIASLDMQMFNMTAANIIHDTP